MNKLELTKQYYLDDKVNYSFLKTFMYPNPFFHITMKDKRADKSKLYWEENEHFTRGNLVDAKLTMSEYFNEMFYIADEPKPNDKIKSIMKYLHDNKAMDWEFDRFTDEYLLNVADQEGFWHSNTEINDKGKEILLSGGRTKEFRLNAIKKEKEYFEFLNLAKGRTIVSPEEYDIAMQCVEGLMAKPYVQYLVNNAESQFRVDWNYGKYECKSLLDFADITETTIRAIDVKSTTLPLHDILTFIRRGRYDGQLRYYSEGLKRMFPDKKLLLPQLIISSTTEPNNPQIVTLSQRDYNIAWNGSKYNTVEISDGKESQIAYLKRKQPIYGIKTAFDNYEKYQQGERFQVNTTKLWDGV